MQTFPNYWRNWNCGLWNGFATKIEDSQCYSCEPYKEICTRPQPNSPRTIKSYNRKRSLGEIWRTFGGTYEKEGFIPIQITFNKMKNVPNRWSHLGNNNNNLRKLPHIVYWRQCTILSGGGCYIPYAARW